VDAHIHKEAAITKKSWSCTIPVRTLEFFQATYEMFRFPALRKERTTPLSMEVPLHRHGQGRREGAASSGTATIVGHILIPTDSSLP